MPQDPETWRAAAWCKVYNFPICSKGMAIRGEKFVESKFTHPPHLKDGYPLSDCKDLRARRMLEFLIPILYPKKPARVTITVGNIIFGAYTGERVIDWMLVVRDTIRKLMTGIGNLILHRSVPTCCTSIMSMTPSSRRTRRCIWLGSPLLRTMLNQMKKSNRLTQRTQTVKASAWERLQGSRFSMRRRSLLHPNASLPRPAKKRKDRLKKEESRQDLR